MSKHLLIVEDDSALIAALTAHYTKHYPDMDVEVVHCVDDAILHCSRSKPDLVFLDLIMPGKRGEEFLRHVQENNLEIPVIVASNIHEAAIMEECKNLGAIDFVVKSNMSLKEVADLLNSHLQTP